MAAARAALILGQPFFGALALRLALVEDTTCATAWVDGESLGYNPQFIEGLTPDELQGLVCHEVLHVANGHPWRRDHRDADTWNRAADYSINPIVIDAGMRLPAGGLLDAQYSGRSAEFIHARLQQQDQDQDQQQQQQPQGGDQQPQGGDQPQQQPQGDQQQQGEQQPQQGEQGEQQPQQGEQGEQQPQGQQQPQPAGEVRDAPAAAPSEDQWQQAVQQAATAAKGRGLLGGDLRRQVEQILQPRVDWRAVLRRFIDSAARADYTWTQPSPRYIASGLYLPSLQSNEMGALAVAVDTSGSVDQVTLAQLVAEVQSIADELQPSRVHVLSCDTRVRSIDTYERGEQIAADLIGGGGTRFQPVFDAVADLDEPPAAIVYLTDLCGPDAVESDVPTIWACTTDRVAPWGETVHIDG